MAEENRTSELGKDVAELVQKLNTTIAGIRAMNPRDVKNFPIRLDAAYIQADTLIQQMTPLNLGYAESYRTLLDVAYDDQRQKTGLTPRTTTGKLHTIRHDPAYSFKS